jgi:hypothetical protein
LSKQEATRGAIKRATTSSKQEATRGITMSNKHEVTRGATIRGVKALNKKQ